MHRTEAQFCLDQGERILKLATDCEDPELQDQLLKLAQEWTERSKALMTLAGDVAKDRHLTKRH